MGISEKINWLCTIYEASRYGQVDRDEANRLREICSAYGAKTEEEVYGLYRLDREFCVVYRDDQPFERGMDVTGPVEVFTRPYYGKNNYCTRRLTPTEVAKLAANEPNKFKRYMRS